MPKKLLSVFLVLILLFSVCQVHGSNVCPNAELWSGRLLTDICWDCIFPIIIGGVPIGNIDDAPDERADPFPPFMCLCEGEFGVDIGVPIGLWEPARLVELTRLPFCSPVLGGISLQLNSSRLLGGASSREGDSGDKVFYNYHYFAFPLLIIMELLNIAECNADGFLDFDLMYLSELDPTWNDDELSLYTTPEVVLFANPFAQMACIADAVAGLAGETLSSMFWCAGNWGGLYPFTGNILQNASRPLATSLAAAKAIAALHRRGLAWKTMGDDALCGGYLFPTIPKEQYRMSMFFPVAETRDNHVIGETPFRWGEWRNIPGYEDYVYIVWRWKDCCIR
ncbi:MAG: TraU family protein [Deltaproteobacteria bacterium]|nr:TraU family protein [Deltaproteobacteria bacterium]